MCPSYMATRNEEHSTRGRANALVKALSEPDRTTALGDERLHEVLDLCLDVQGVQERMPARRRHGHAQGGDALPPPRRARSPARSRVFGSIRLLNRLGSATAPLSNLPGRIRPLRLLMDRWLGITPASAAGLRPRQPGALVPQAREAARRHGRRQPAGHASPISPTPSPPTPSPASAAPPSNCSSSPAGTSRWRHGAAAAGPAFSKGLVDEAKEQARRLARLLTESTQPGSPVVGCEPSCLMTLRDEHRAHAPGRPGRAGRRRTRAAGRGAARRGDRRRPSAAERGRLAAGRRILYHGHCHQKAEVGTAATVALLERIPGAEVVELDAGCCGMAGSFGFESEHYDVSMTVGDDRLFPAITAEPDETVVAATGVSCRQQIFQP